ncbi:MAG TPA: hypothetical protein PLJ88_00615 [Agitococcus sp.]|nr:hypothetical protein [Agitococcus sp.]
MNSVQLAHRQDRLLVVNSLQEYDAACHDKEHCLDGEWSTTIDLLLGENIVSLTLTTGENIVTLTIDNDQNMLGGSHLDNVINHLLDVLNC